jgi:hypothetical protein
VRVDTQAGAHYLQYSFNRRLHVVNGFTQALNGLRDFAVLANDADGRTLFAQGEAQLRAELPSFDTGAWSLYARPGVESDLGYHKLRRDFLRGLCDRMTEDRARDGAVAAGAPDPALYCDTAQRFTQNLTTKPQVAVTVPEKPLRAKRAAGVAFTLDKVSFATVTMVRGGKVVLTRTARLGRGTHRVGIRPAQAGTLLVRVRAVDLAGNANAGSAEIPVRPAAKKPPKN